MMHATHDLLQLIAGAELDKLFPDLAPRHRDDLIQSVARQWTACAGHAGIFTEAMNYWLHFEELPDGQFAVHTATAAEIGLRELLRGHGALADDIPRILLRLTLRQTAVFDNEEMVTFEVRVSPHLRRFEIERFEDEE